MHAFIIDMSINIKCVCVCVVWVSTATIKLKKKEKKTQDPEFRTVKGFEPFKPFYLLKL